MQLAARIVAGGYPEALTRQSAHRRTAWYRDYIETLVQRDVRELARISSLDVLPRLLALAASQTSHLINISDLGGPFSLSRPTIRDYVTLLERVFLLEDSIWQEREIFGQMLETFVFQETRRQASFREDQIRFSHYRDKDGFVIQALWQP